MQHLILGALYPRASYALAIHFATFNLSDESYGEPVTRLEQAKQQAGLPTDSFRALKIGEH